MIEAVIKIGGSLQRYPFFLVRLCKTIEEISKQHDLLVVPGGGKFVDLVRELQKKYGFSDRVAHEMAILGMDIYGLMIHDLIKGSIPRDTVEVEGSSGCTIFLPYRSLGHAHELEPSWGVTSDSIAARVAEKISCRKLILVKAVDGIFSRGKLLKRRSIQELKKIKQSVVDPKLHEILGRGGVTCWIVNGKYPDRIKAILAEKETICTVVSP